MDAVWRPLLSRHYSNGQAALPSDRAVLAEVTVTVVCRLSASPFAAALVREYIFLHAAECISQQDISAMVPPVKENASI